MFLKLLRLGCPLALLLLDRLGSSFLKFSASWAWIILLPFLVLSLGSCLLMVLWSKGWLLELWGSWISVVCFLIFTSSSVILSKDSSLFSWLVLRRLLNRFLDDLLKLPSGTFSPFFSVTTLVFESTILVFLSLLSALLFLAFLLYRNSLMSESGFIAETDDEELLLLPLLESSFLTTALDLNDFLLLLPELFAEIPMIMLP